jgi:ankyrin
LTPGRQYVKNLNHPHFLLFIVESAPMPPRPDLSKNKEEFAEAVRRGVNAPVDEEGRAWLHVSAATGNHSAAAILLRRRGADANQEDAQRRTPLYDAIAAKDAEMAALLLQHGARLDRVDASGMTPLLAAVATGDIAFLDQLRGLGLKLDYRYPGGPGALHLAVAAGDRAMAEYLLGEGVPLDAADGAGRTPLHTAAALGQAGLFHFLLARGADPLALTEKGETPLHLALQRGDAEVCALLLELPEVRRTLNDFATTRDGYTPLHTAVAHNRLALAEEMVSLGAHLNGVDGQGRNSFFLAAEEGHAAMAEMLARAGADVGKALPANDGQPILHRVNAAGAAALLPMLVRAGIDVNTADATGRTALLDAAEQHDVEKVKALLALGADPDLGDTRGRRPLDAAVSAATRAENADAHRVVAALLAAGAHPGKSPSDDQSYPPLQLAVRGNNLPLARLLLDHKAAIDELNRVDASTALLEAVYQGKKEMWELLLSRGADTTAVNGVGRNVLHYAAQNGAAELVQALLRDPRMKKLACAPAVNGETPLLSALRRDNFECARMLMAAGADPLAADTAGFTALHRAAQCRTAAPIDFLVAAAKGKLDLDAPAGGARDTAMHIAARQGKAGVVSRLIALGADPLKANSNGETPLLAAARANSPLSVQELLDYMKQNGLAIDGQRDKMGLGALHHAASLRRAKTLEPLLDAGAPVDSRTLAGETPLHIAIREGHADTARLLIARGADETLANNNGETPESLARASADAEIAALFGPEKPQQPAVKPGRNMSAAIRAPRPKRQP